MRTFLLMLGSALGGVIIFVAGVYVYLWHQWSRMEPGAVLHLPGRGEKTVSSAPPIVSTERFYGTFAMMAGGFPPDARQTVLAAGPGKLVGVVTSGGNPLQGLRLRLALNGAVMTQWAVSGAEGRYEIPVPYAKYRLDGYELDSEVVHKVLGGKIDGPRHQMHPLQEVVVVEEGKPANALDFAFVDPVRKKGPRGDVSLAQPVIASWEPYPGASAYRLQLIEQQDPADYAGHKRLFEWRQRPIVAGTSANLAEQGAKLQKGYYYTVEIEALDDNKRKLSEAPRTMQRADFRVVE
jgi:hypothetical protein